MGVIRSRYHSSIVLLFRQERDIVLKWDKQTAKANLFTLNDSSRCNPLKRGIFTNVASRASTQEWQERKDHHCKSRKMKKPKWLSQNIRLFKCAASCANKVGNTALQTCVFSGNVNFQVPLICGAIFSDMNFVTKMQLNVLSFDSKCLSSYQMHKTKLIFTEKSFYVLFERCSVRSFIACFSSGPL